MERNEPIPLLGLALRGGRLSIGEDAVRDTVRSGRARLLLLASDASERTRRYAAGLAAEGNVLLLSLPCTKEALGRGLGRGDVAVTALTDAGLAAAVGQRLAALDPAAYGDTAARLEVKWKRAQERRENRGNQRERDNKQESDKSRKPRKPEEHAEHRKPRKPGEYAEHRKPRKPGEYAEDRKPRSPGEYAENRKPRKPGEYAEDRKPRKPGEHAEHRKTRKPGEYAEHRKPRKPGEHAGDRKPRKPGEHTEYRKARGPGNHAPPDARRQSDGRRQQSDRQKRQFGWKKNTGSRARGRPGGGRKKRRSPDQH